MSGDVCGYEDSDNRNTDWEAKGNRISEEA
jgi:hypothetical protein